MNHVHIGGVDALKTFGYVLVIGFFWRTISIALSDTPIGQAMAYLY